MHTFWSSGTDAMHLGAPDSTASCCDSLGHRMKESLDHDCLCLGQHICAALAVGLQAPSSTAEKLMCLAFKALSQMLIIRDISQPVSHHHLLTLHQPLLQAQTALSNQSVLDTTKS